MSFCEERENLNDRLSQTDDRIAELDRIVRVLVTSVKESLTERSIDERSGGPALRARQLRDAGWSCRCIAAGPDHGILGANG